MRAGLLSSILGVGVALSLVAGGGCKDRDDLDGERRKLPGLEDRGQVLELVPPDGRVAYDLYANRASVVVHAAGGLEIAAGTVDFVKYIEGGYQSPWHVGAGDGGEPVALIDGLAGELYAPIDDEVARGEGGALPISFEVKPAADDQLVSVFLNERKLGDVAMPSRDWKKYQLVAPASAVVRGENKLRFYFRHSGEVGGTRTAAAFRRFRFGEGAGGQVMTAGQAVRGGERVPALRMSGAGRLSYYLRVPDDRPELAFAAGGADGTKLEVRVTSGAAGDFTKTLWSGAASEAWNQASVDLSEYAGDVVRLDLVATGAADWGRPQIVVPDAESDDDAGARREPADHVIIWAVSALRLDRAGGEVPTPAIDRLASRGVRFTRAVSAAPSPGPAHVALLSGRYPEGDSIPASDKTLAERFHEAGYTTALVSGNGFVNDDAGFAQGFDVYRNPMRLRRPFGARYLWQRARKILRDHADDRTFIYLATVEPHLPYTPSAESLAQEWSGAKVQFSGAQTTRLSARVAAGTEKLTEQERDYVRALYDAEVRDADDALGEMLADLDQMGLVERTAVVLVGDHGEELFERGNFGHGGHLHEEVLRVPLVVALPDREGAPKGSRAVDAPVASVDVYATALDLAGISINPEAQGRSALALLEGRTDPARPLMSVLPGRARSITIGPHKLIVPRRGPRELFDLGADPGETESLMGTRPIVERYLRNAFGLAVAYRKAWSPARWGSPANTRAAFPADHGL